MLVTREKSKYERVWADPRYRRHSPGEQLVLKAMEMGMEPGDSLIDYGCGCGRAMEAFSKLGLDVSGVDLAGNCLDPNIGLPFRIECLWSLPFLESDWAYCTDVMEHIPEEKIDAVFQGIKAKKGAFFQIAMRPDSSGMMIIGEQLHLTIKGIDWWERKIKKHWGTVEMTDLGTRCIAECKPT